MNFTAHYLCTLQFMFIQEYENTKNQQPLEYAVVDKSKKKKKNDDKKKDDKKKDDKQVKVHSYKN